MTLHELKCWPELFDFMVMGMKSFECRKNDRNFQMHDLLWLRCYEPTLEEAPERDKGERQPEKQGTYCAWVAEGEDPVGDLLFRVDMVVEDFMCPGLKKGYCIMQLTQLDWPSGF